MSSEEKGEGGPLRLQARRFVKFAVSGVLVFWLLRTIGLNPLHAQLSRISLTSVAVSLAVFALSNLLGALQWHWLMRAKRIHISYHQTLAFYHVGLFFNNFLIGNVGGDAVRVLDIRRLAGKNSPALSTVFFDRFAGFFAMASLAFLAAMLMAQKLVRASAVYTILIVFPVWILALLFLFNERIALKFAWIFKLLLPQSLHARARSFYNSLHGFRHQKKLLLRILLLSFAVQLLRILTHYWAARALGVRISFFYFLLFIPIVALVASLPISLGGLGVREQSAVTLFSQIGLASAQVVAFEFLAYLVAIAASLPGGIIFALRHDKQ